MNSLVPERVLLGLVTCALGLGSVSVAHADDPKFEFGKADGAAKEKEKDHWKASAQAGLLLASGNSNAVTISAGGNVIRNDGKNKIALEVSGSYGRSSSFVPRTDAPKDAMGNAIIANYDDISTESRVTTQLWALKLRYDRFFSPNNLGYLAAAVRGDELAGKKIAGGIQIGYSRQFVKNERSELLAELGYDLTFETYLNDIDPTLQIHSLRAFLGYSLTLTKDTAITTGLEGLFNVNPLTAPGSFDREHPEITSKEVKPFEDTRINFKAALSTKIYKNISFRFAFVTRFDNVPAPRANLAGAVYTGFRPVAEKVDTLSEAALVVSFL